MKVRLGMIARADNSGLGIQTLEFYRHMQPAKTMVVNISHLNRNRIYPNRYPERAHLINGFPQPQDIEEFLKDLDVVFVAESPYNYFLYERARELGVKTAVQYNYEFFDWFANPRFPKPDMLIAPSKWHFADVNAWVNHTNQHTGTNIAHLYLHCPVNRELLPSRKITKARLFLHIAGRAAAHDRNGTKTVIAASKFLKTNAQIKVHFQGEQGLPHQVTNTWADYVEYAHEHGDTNKLSIYRNEYDEYQEIYKEGDVLVLPRRYGGNCLTLNEALSVGMPVIMSDISPNNDFLPEDWLVPAAKIGDFKPRTVIDIYDVKPKVLAAKIDEFYLLDKERMHYENMRADTLAMSISWTVLKSEYERVLEQLCTR